jgi:hypothetical protein
MRKLLLFVSVLFVVNFSFGLPKDYVNGKAYVGGNVVSVSSLSDFPSPVNGKITLDGTKHYVMSGMIDIQDNYIDLNGAGFTGTDPGKDGVMSRTSGAVLRSNEKNVFLIGCCVLLASPNAKAYEFVDKSNTHFCNLFPSTSVLDVPGIKTQGVGSINGFEATCISLNYWNTTDGLKYGGKSLKLSMTVNYIRELDKIGIEFMPDCEVKDVIIQGCYFTYNGALGVKVDDGAKIDQGRFCYNLFRGPKKEIEGFDSYTPGWEMNNNGETIPDSKAKGFVYFNENTTPTNIKVGEYTKIEGISSTLTLKRFKVVGNNRLVFTGKRRTNIEVTGIISSISNYANGSYSIVIMKNGKEVQLPRATVTSVAKGNGFDIRLDTQCELSSNDYIELFVKSNTAMSDENLVVTDFQIKAYEQ